MKIEWLTQEDGRKQISAMKVSKLPMYEYVCLSTCQFSDGQASVNFLSNNNK